MSRSLGKVVVAMSGGVDSSVAACLLAEQGYEIVGLFMRVGADDKADDASSQVCVSSLMAEADGGADTDHTQRVSTSKIALPIHAANSSDNSSSTHANGSSQVNGSSTQDSNASSREHKGCCSASDAADARFVAGMLDVPFYALNFKQDFDSIIDYFADEYAVGRTPNPCVVCNDRLKFGRILEYADAVGAEFIATGHYARIGERNGQRVLMRGVDESKDQSYVLFGLEREVLDRVLFPIGHLPKSEVREIATKHGLPVDDKPDSVDICFVPDRDYARVVRSRRPDAFVPGDIVDTDGHVLGQHEGLAQFTIGQRRGLKIAAGHPIYVTELDVENNRVVMGKNDALMNTVLVADRVNIMVDLPETFRARVKIRYLHRAAPATITRLEDAFVRIEFDSPQRAITPGQATVFYDGDVVLGGGWIT